MPIPGRGRKGDELIDRTPQNLPVQVGGFRVVRENRRTSQYTKWWRSNAPNLLALCGLIFAAWGAYLATAAPVTAAYLRGNQYVIGNVSLTETSTKGVFGGSAGTIILIKRADQSYDASAATQSSGKDVAGHCHFDPPTAARLSETCEFWINAGITSSPTLRSTDTLDLAQGSVWRRQYSDGVSVDISVPSDGVAAPIPLPVGR